MASRITLPEREKLFELLAQNKPKASIAKSLNRHRSVIYKEIQRVDGKYSPSAAHADAIHKSKNSKKNIKLQNEELKNFVIARIIIDNWSPEQISHRLKKLYPNNDKMNVSTETIYQHIYNIKDETKKNEIIKCLRRRKKKRYSRKYKAEKRGTIPNLKSIQERPSIVEERSEIGHWEGDQIIGKNHKSAIGTLVERD